MNPRVILHIGQQKTGTTTLQRALVADRERLLEAGILYPDVGHSATRSGDDVQPAHNGLFFGLEGRRTKRISQTPDDMRGELARQIAAASPQVVIISAERAFQAADHREDLLDRLDRLIAGPKRVVAYLRRPDRYVASFHKHDVRMGARVAALHTSERMSELEQTCRLDHARALGLFAGRYGGIELFRYEHIGDTLRHFYDTVLELEPPSDVSRRANPSLPSVFTNLARERITDHGRLERRQVRALIKYGEREPVDLLGTDNRARLVHFYRDHNAYLGSLVGRPVFFEDLEAAAEPDPNSISVAEADERYREMFTALLSTPDVYALRARCIALEHRGWHEAAAQLFELFADNLDDEDIAWFRSDLETSGKGTWTIENRRYAERDPAPTAS